MQKNIILVFLVLTFICSCSEMNKPASYWLEKEKALWDGQQYTNPKQAIKYLNNAIKLEPNNAVTYTHRGDAYYGLGQYQQAIEDFNKAIQMKPDFVDAYFSRGLIYITKGDNVSGCRDAQNACKLGNCKLLDAANRRKLCR